MFLIAFLGALYKQRYLKLIYNITTNNFEYSVNNIKDLIIYYYKGFVFIRYRGTVHWRFVKFRILRYRLLPYTNQRIFESLPYI